MMIKMPKMNPWNARVKYLAVANLTLQIITTEREAQQQPNISVSKAAIKKCHLEGPKCYPRLENVPTTQSFGPQKKYFHAEQAIKKLKRYTEKGICLEDLQ